MDEASPVGSTNEPLQMRGGRESTDKVDPAPWTRPALNGMWYSGG